MTFSSIKVLVIEREGTVLTVLKPMKGKKFAKSEGPLTLNDSSFIGKTLKNV